MKVLFVVSRLPRAGPTRQLLYLCRHLSGAGIRASVLTLSPEPKFTLIDEFRAEGIIVESLGLGRWTGELIGRRRLENALARLRPQIIHTQGIRADTWVHSLQPIEAVHFLTMRNYPWKDYPVAYGKLMGSLMARHHLGILANCQVAVACSRSAALELSRRVGREVIPIQNGVDVRRFCPPDPVRKLELRKKFGIPPCSRVIVSVGDLTERKAQDIVVRGFLGSALTSKSLLLVVGEGPLRGRLEHICSSVGEARVRMVGATEDVISYLQMADGYVSASRAEGLPNSVLEALSCGLPVVLSDIDPHRELGVEESNAGRLFRVDDPADLARQIDYQFVLSESGVASREAHHLAIKTFGSEVMVAQYAALYQDLLERRLDKMEAA